MFYRNHYLYGLNRVEHPPIGTIKTNMVIIPSTIPHSKASLLPVIRLYIAFASVSSNISPLAFLAALKPLSPSKLTALFSV